MNKQVLTHISGSIWGITLLSIPILITSLRAETQLLASSHSIHQEHMNAASYAPAGVMGDHLHHAGGWMFSYQLMDMQMEGMQSGSHQRSVGEIATMTNSISGESMRMGNQADGSPRVMTVPDTYRIVPTDMDVKMHMFSLMYGISNNVTAMAMVNYTEKDMTLLTFKGASGTKEVARFNGHTSGIGDTQIGVLLKLQETENYKVNFNIGLSLPTGNIEEKGAVLPPFSGNVGTQLGELVDIDRLAYSMQLGSGSYELLSGATYTAKQDDLTWGAQLKATVRLNDNSQNYRLGNIIEAQAWFAKQWKPSVSTSIRLAAKSEGSIRGRDLTIMGGNPLSNPDNSGRNSVILHLGVNLAGQYGSLKGHRLALEVGAPLYEKVDGVQMSSDWITTLAWKKSF